MFFNKTHRMKKYLFIAVLATASMMVYAQPRAIGGRMGAFCGVSYEHSLSEKNMVEMELGWGLGARLDGNYNGTGWWFSGNDIELAATYDWIDPFNAKFPWDEQGEWHWYLGAGAAGGYGWNAYTSSTTGGVKVGITGSRNWGFVGAVARVGFEYDFWFPLQLSVDYRPTIGVGLADNFSNGVDAGCYWNVTGISLGVRYKF
jgi:opacity protein-like surface antigen